MSFEQIVGQERAKRMIQNGLRSGKLSHAYLFHGPKGTGKRAMALCMAKALLCERQQDDACGSCVACRKVDHDNHPGIHHIKPDGHVIKLEQIKQLQHALSFRNTADEARIYIIHDAERMTTEAANRMLKFLEDPPQRVIAILMTDNGQAIMPTIQSRAVWIPFVPMSPDEMLAALIEEGIDATLALPAVHLATGLDGARQLAMQHSFAELRNVMIQLAKATSFASASLLIHHKLLKTELKDEIVTLLDLFVLWYKDMIHIQSGRQDHVVFKDELPWLVTQAFSRHIQHWLHCMEQAMIAQQQWRRHVHPQLLLERFMSQV